jgi:hypothetical protein
MNSCSEPTGRPQFDIGEIARKHRRALEAEERLSSEQRQVLSSIEKCRTSAMGGHVDVCDQCDFERPSYNSCRNRHCPKCQMLRQERWIEARTEALLPVEHFHVVFTLPSELRALARYNPRVVFDALFASVRDALLELGQSRFKARLGITAVLHTWTRELNFHPHLHTLVTAGGMSVDRAGWLGKNGRFLFPVRVMGALLRGKMLAALRHLYKTKAFDGFGAFEDPEGFDQLMTRLARPKGWVVYAKRPFKRVEHVLQYLGRYTHRVGISNSRIQNVTDEAVTFATRNGRSLTLKPVEFLKRFVLHVLPKKFHKIRHFGLYAGAAKEARLRALKALGEKIPRTRAIKRSWEEVLLDATGHDIRRCPNCDTILSTRHMFLQYDRGPP